MAESIRLIRREIKREMSEKRTLDEFYREEIRFLRERGAKFSRAFPNLMQFFSDSGRRDPHVERILEGTAFLTAKLEMMLEKNQAHSASELLKLFWPQALSPIPSMSLVQMKLRGTTGFPQLFPKNSFLESSRVQTSTGDFTNFKFVTRSEITVNPLEITSGYLKETDGNRSLVIRFKTTGGSTLDKLDFSKPVRIHIHDPDETAMFRAYDDIKFRTEPSRQCSISVAEASGMQSVGNARFDFPNPISLDPIIPVQKDVFPGFRMLQEFLIIPAWFLSFELYGLDCLSEYKSEQFEIEIRFNKKQLPVYEWRKDAFRLHCVPAVNLYPGKCRAITTSLEQWSYKLIGEESVYSPGKKTIHSLTNVTLKRQGEQWEQDLPPFNIFDREYEFSIDEKRRPSYSLEYESIRSGDTVTGRDVSIVLRNIPEVESDVFYSLHVDALWSDQDINQYLREIRINRGSSDTMECLNLNMPSPYFPPLDPEKWRWVLVEVMSLNYQSIDTIEGVKRLLKILNPDTKRRDIQVYSDSLADLRLETKRFFEGRLPVNGQQFVFSVKDSLFRGTRGKMFAFFDILHSFLSEYISINSRVSISVHCIDSPGEKYEFWEPRPGSRRVL